MKKADFKARVKKIEIVNRVLTDSWTQSIRVILEDIELTNENLLELKQFKPNEQVLVELSPVQVNLFELVPQTLNKAQAGTVESDNAKDKDEFLAFTTETEEEELFSDEKVVREFRV